MYNPNIWWHFFQFSIFMIFASLFIFKVFEHKLRISKLGFWIVIILYTTIVSFVIALVLTEISPYQEFAPLGTVGIIVLSTTVLKIIIKKYAFSLFFLFFLFLNIQYNTLAMAKATFAFDVIPQVFDYDHANTLLLSLVYALFILPFLYYLLVKLYKRIIEEHISFKRMEFFFCLPAGFFFAIYLFMKPIYYSPTGNIKETLLPLLVINICALGSYFAILKSILVIHDASLKHEALHASELKQLLLEERCESLQNKITSESRARHDWRHHIITIVGFVEKQDLSGLAEYLTEYKDKYLFPDSPRICNIDALDMLFQYYQRKAVELDIDLTINTIVFDASQIAISDLIIVFGNLLANAIEACKKTSGEGKYIKLKIRNREKNIIAIICENNFDGILLKTDNTIVSRKKEGGIGLSSIETIVEKNNGILDIKTEGTDFKVYVALHM